VPNCQASLHILLLNKGARAATFALRLPTVGTGTAERLLAPSPKSKEGQVTFAGQRIGEDARWRGTRIVEQLEQTAGGYQVTIRGYGAVLLSFRVRQERSGPANNATVATTTAPTAGVPCARRS